MDPNLSLQISDTIRGYSIETTPAGAAKIEALTNHVPAGTTVNVTYLAGADLADTLTICRRLADEGMIPVPHVSPPSAAESRFAARHGWPPERRLACQMHLRGDVVVDVPAGSQIHKQVIVKELNANALTVDPLLRLYFVTVPPADLATRLGDLERLGDALADQWPDAELADRLTADGHVLATLQCALATNDGQVTVALRDGWQVVAIWPGLRTQALGLAVDIGSTTLSAHLVDLATGWAQATASMMNPRIPFGDDMMSWVSYVQMNADGQEALTGAIRQAVADLPR